jgi:hypothetical protein
MKAEIEEKEMREKQFMAKILKLREERSELKKE